MQSCDHPWFTPQQMELPVNLLIKVAYSNDIVKDTEYITVTHIEENHYQIYKPLSTGINVIWKSRIKKWRPATQQEGNDVHAT